MLIQIRQHKELQAYHEGAPKRGPKQIPMTPSVSPCARLDLIPKADFLPGKVLGDL